MHRFAGQAWGIALTLRLVEQNFTLRLLRSSSDYNNIGSSEKSATGITACRPELYMPMLKVISLENLIIQAHLTKPFGPHHPSQVAPPPMTRPGACIEHRWSRISRLDTWAQLGRARGSLARDKIDRMTTGRRPIPQWRTTRRDWRLFSH